MAERKISQNIKESLGFPYEHHYVLIDTENDAQKATQRWLERIPLTFTIRYKDAAIEPPSLTLIINPQNIFLSGKN